MSKIVSRIKNTTTRQRAIAIVALILIAGGTVSSAQLYDYIGLKFTSVKLEIEEVYVEPGNTITAGTQLYKLTDKSVADAKAKLDKELRSAESALLNQNLSYKEAKNDAYSLYQSELLLGETAQNDYNTGISQLDSALQTALDDYNNALDTINNTPNQIASKNSEIETLNAEISSYESELTGLEADTADKKKSYTDATSTYNTAVSEYNAIAGTVRYIGNYLGMDVSDVQLAQSAPSEDAPQNGMTDTSSNMQPGIDKPDLSSRTGAMHLNAISLLNSAEPIITTTNTGLLSDIPETEPPVQTPAEETTDNSLRSLYESARAEYMEEKRKLSEAESAYLTAKNEGRRCFYGINQCFILKCFLCCNAD